MMLGSGLAYFKILLLGRLLEREAYGQYLYLLSAVSYLVPLVGLGLLDGFSRAQPILTGAGKLEEARELRNTCLGAISVISPCVVAVLGGLAFAFNLPRKGFEFEMLALAGVQLIVIQYYYLFLRDIRSNLKTTQYAAFMCIRGVLDLAAVVPLSREWGVRGALIGDAGSMILVTLALSLFAVDGPALRLSKLSALTSLAKEGAQIILAGLACATALIMDRLVLGLVLSPREYAVYGVHALTLTATGIGTNIVYQYTFPRLVQLQSGPAATGELLIATRRLSMRILGVALLLGPAVYLGFLMLARVFYPGYPIDHVLLAILCLAAVVEVANVYPTSLVAMGRHRLNLAVQILFVLLMLAGMSTAIVLGAGVRWIAALLLAGRAIAWLTGAAALERAGSSPAGAVSVRAE